MELQVMVNERETGKKSLLKQLRRDKKTPAVIYGANFKPEAVWVDEKEISGIIKHSKTSVLTLNEGKKKLTAVIKDVSYDALSDRVNHVDFMKIEAKKELDLTIPLELEGACKGVKEGGILDFIVREIEIRTIPSKIPHSVKIDVSDLAIGDTMKISELHIPEGVTVLTPGDHICISIQAPRKEEEAAVTEAEAGAAEPEVEKKGKDAKGAPEAEGAPRRAESAPKRAEGAQGRAEAKKPADKK
ncbi:MAG: 50S ribosomal protein L25 [Elusimicrobia bacterium CG03_land_8_20_14_0_80_50_18]|nr:MAG: 50S ribosomal protein L25 [Elusimicrobia bacterium CG03_land_8_20_14_0_80_50_18]